MSKNINTECGIVSLVSKEPVTYTILTDSLTKLQHRGRESFGISYLENNYHHVEKYMGLIKKNELSQEIKNVYSNIWGGHVRYSTSGKKVDKLSIKSKHSFLKLTQPISFNFVLNGKSKYAIFIYNGNIPFSIWKNIFKIYPLLGYYYYNNKNNEIDINDSLLMIKLINILALSNQYTTFKDVLIRIINIIDRAFCIIIKFHNEEWIIRDKLGVRPLVLGLSNNNKKIIVASEDCCFDKTIFRLVNDIKPGNIVKIDYNTLKVKIEYQSKSTSITKHCIFEYFYFMRKNTTVNNINVSQFRRDIGKLLYKDIQIKTTLFMRLKQYVKNNQLIVCGIPESGIIQAQSFSDEIKGTYLQFIEKNKKNPHRTFILENNKARLNACKNKYIISKEHQLFIKDKILVLVDDSIVRGNTLKYLIDFIKEHKPKEIHFLSASPPIINKCSYGVDFPDIEDLIASKMTIPNIEKQLNIDSLTYLSKEYFDRDNYKNKFCLECFNN